MQLLFFDVFTRGVGDLDGAWPDEHGLSPIAEGGNVSGECRYHGRNANESMQADKGNLERKVYFHQTAAFSTIWRRSSSAGPTNR